jgi:flagellum-specific ATP synthase
LTVKYLDAVRDAKLHRRSGRIRQFFGSVVEADGPDAFLGEWCELRSDPPAAPITAEVVGFKDGRVLLMPYGDLHGIRIGCEVVATGRTLDVPVGDALLGRVIDALGRPLDHKGPLNWTQRYPLLREPINPLERRRIDTVLETGVKAIDTVLTLGRGQRIGIFSGSGVGKSTLLGMIARNMSADVNVIAMVGERGREVWEFIEDCLGPEGLARSVLVVATSDQPALVRAHAAFTATAIAEYFRDRGQDVVLTMDSVTRFAMARRELGLAIGEPPTARGYTPSVFAALPKLLERAGTRGEGSITGLYTVLVEADDMTDPIADTIRAVVDGDIVLSRELANQRHYPAIDVLSSVSRLMPQIVSEPEMDSAKQLVAMLGRYEASRDMVEVGAYRAGSQPDLDKIIEKMTEILAFLSQDRTESVTRGQALAELNAVVRGRTH